MKTLKKNEKDLKVIAEYFVEHGGCEKLHCFDCPLYRRGDAGGCSIKVASTKSLAEGKDKQWAINYLEQFKKLEFLEKLQ